MPQEQNVTPKSKQKLILIIAAILGVMLLMLGAILLIERFVLSDRNAPADGKYEFYPPYNGDIQENEAYLELDRQVYYCNDPSGYGVTESIDPTKKEDYPPEVMFLYDYLQAVIAGDAEAYRLCHNAAFLKKQELPAAFYPQMLHRMELRFMNEVKEGNDRLVTYRVSYLIFQNDGSFRRDIDSETMRPQDITLRISANGTVAIERSVTLYPSKK